MATKQIQIQNNYNFKEAINEYFKLKNKYQTAIQNDANKITRDKKLTKREKKTAFQSLKAKCINCQRPVGTLFSTKFDKEKDYRILSAFCGDIVNPCDLRIVINAGRGIESYLDIIMDVEKDIQKYKNNLIQDKNNLLFGYITTEEALANFEFLKKEISELTNSYSFHLSEFNDITDNKQEKEILNKNQETAYLLIDEIKETIAKFNENKEISFVNDSVEIYVNQLQPLLTKIRNSKYTSSRVELEDHIYHLIQEKFTLQDIESANVLPEVLEFHLGSGNRINQKTRKMRETTDNKKTRKNRNVLEKAIQNKDEEEEDDDE